MAGLKAPQIPENELNFSASRSGGPGGQNVNKVNSRVTVTFNVRDSPSLTDEQRARIEDKLGHRMTNEGNLQTVSQTHRSQFKNREDAVLRMQALIDSAFLSRRKRRKTRPTRAAIKKRLREKARRSEIKKQRQRPDIEG